MHTPGKRRIIGVALAVVAVIGIGLLSFSLWRPRIAPALAAYRNGDACRELVIDYPRNGTLFPKEIVPPVFKWTDADTKADRWVVRVAFDDKRAPIQTLVKRPSWEPSVPQWEQIKQRSLERPATVTILGIRWLNPADVLSAAACSIATSSDPVAAPLFYREVNLPFEDAVKDPSRIKWRFGDIASTDPPVVLEGLPVCGNCHSFSSEGDKLAMDIDYANSKGSYVITNVAEEMKLATSDIITWNDYRKEDGEQTFGLLSQISPDGRYVVSTVKDKSVFVPRPDIAFSQLFFPLKGILCVYDTVEGTYRALPGADDPNYVQSNPVWSPDGKYIVFARAEAYDLENTAGEGKVLLTREECREFLEDGKPFRFDLYRVAFNGGRGATAEPIEGASNNGMSNFFAKYSPDGKWIVFCRADSYMLLQPDSELFIIPAEGGSARRLECNTDRMNSWHSWSPNGKWLVFASKAYSPYTQLMLTHIDEQGRSTPPVLLSHFTRPDGAANIPEFVNTQSHAIRRIHEEFLDDYSFVRAGNQFFMAGDTDNAIAEYRNALELNPNNASAHRRLGFLLYNAKGRFEKGFQHYLKALELAPEDPRVQHDVGMALLHQGKMDQAIVHLSKAVTGLSRSIDKQYDPGNLYRALGMAYMLTGKLDEAQHHLVRALEIRPADAEARYKLAEVFAVQGQLARAMDCYRKAVAATPQIDTSPVLHNTFASAYAQQRDFAKAIAHAEKALALARRAQDEKLARAIAESLQMYYQVHRSLQP